MAEAADCLAILQSEMLPWSILSLLEVQDKSRRLSRGPLSVTLWFGLARRQSDCGGRS